MNEKIIKRKKPLLARLASGFVRNVVWKFNPPTFVVLLGGPGAGKGTLASGLAPALGLAHVSTGNLLRAEIQRGTPLGKEVEPIVKSGGLVRDEITIALMEDELSRPANRKGAIIDGFPRTLAQAELLKDLLTRWGQKVDFVFFLDLEADELVKRLSGRRTCQNKECGRSYHVDFDPPKTAGKCDACGSELVIRDDDKPDVVLARLAKFKEANAPILGFYKRQGGLSTIKTTNQDGKDTVLKKALAIMSSR